MTEFKPVSLRVSKKAYVIVYLGIATGILTNFFLAKSSFFWVGIILNTAFSMLGSALLILIYHVKELMEICEELTE